MMETNIDSKIHLIKHEIDSFGYQAFKEKDNGELTFFKDLNFLVPYEYYDSEEEKTFYDFRLPLLKALKDTNATYIEEYGNFIISKQDFEELSEFLFKTKMQNLQKIVDDNRKKSNDLIKEAVLAELEIEKMKASITKPKLR